MFPGAPVLKVWLPAAGLWGGDQKGIDLVNGVIHQWRFNGIIWGWEELGGGPQHEVMRVCSGKVCLLSLLPGHHEATCTSLFIVCHVLLPLGFESKGTS